MKKNEVIKEYCQLSGEVAENVFDWSHAADCFCGDTRLGWDYQYENAVLNYIREAVHQRMKLEGHIA